MSVPGEVKLARHANDLDDDGHDVIAGGSTNAVDINIADAGGYFTATDVEAALQELAKKDIGYTAHGALGAAETFSALTGWHSGTVDDDCTFTFTGATSSLVASMVLELTVDSGGPYTETWPGGSVWPGGSAPTLEASTTYLILAMSRDGGTTWYMFLSGGGGVDLSAIDFLVGTASADLSAEIVVGTTPGGDLGGTWAAPDVQAIQGVAVTDAGTTGDVLTKTGPTAATWSTPAATGGGIGPLLLASDHSVPSVWGDILQDSEGNPLYASAP